MQHVSLLESIYVLHSHVAKQELDLFYVAASSRLLKLLLLISSLQYIHHCVKGSMTWSTNKNLSIRHPPRMILKRLLLCSSDLKWRRRSQRIRRFPPRKINNKSSTRHYVATLSHYSWKAYFLTKIFDFVIYWRLNFIEWSSDMGAASSERNEMMLLSENINLKYFNSFMSGESCCRSHWLTSGGFAFLFS